MSAGKTKKDYKCLYENEVRCIQKISSCKSMFEPLAIFEIELGFGGSEIKCYLDIPRCKLVTRMLGFETWTSKDSTYIFFFHRCNGSIVNSEHQSFIGRCETPHFTAAPIANHVLDGGKMNDLKDNVHIFGEHV